MTDFVLTIRLEDFDFRDEVVSKLEHITEQIRKGYNFGEDWDVEIKEY
jgi:hypothetical protein